MNDKILITGGNGYIGSHLIIYYLEKGNHGVASLDIGSSDSNNSNDYHSIDVTDNFKLSNFQIIMILSSIVQEAQAFRFL